MIYMPFYMAVNLSMGLRLALQRLIFSVSFLLMLNAASFSHAEGEYQLTTALNQPLSSSTTVFIHVPNAGDIIRVHLCLQSSALDPVNVDISSTNVVVGLYTVFATLATLTSTAANIDCADTMLAPLPKVTATGNVMEYVVPAAGVYAIDLLDAGEYDRWDFAVVPGGTPNASVDATAGQGNVFSYEWDFFTSSFGVLDSVSGELYVITSGGFLNTNYVWALDLRGFAGLLYSINANDLGLNAPLSGVSAPLVGSSVTEKHPVYLSYPTGANPLPPPTQFPALLDTLVFIDDAGSDDVISPDGDATEETGNFEFTSDVTGTYAITIDINRNGVFGANDRLLLGRMTENVLTTVNWDGTDTSAVTVPNGRYPVKLELRVGEYHFISKDVETSGGGTNDDGTGDDDGLTIFQALDSSTNVGTLVYWDDETLLGGSSNLPAGAMSSTALTGAHRHTWGDYTGAGIGDSSYIDTYVFGNSTVFNVTAYVGSLNAPPTINNTTLNVDENSALTTSVGTPVANDPDGDFLSFTITAGNLGSAFVIDELTGEITVNGPLDYETLNQYVLTVEVTDQVSVASAAIIIDINDVNETPVGTAQSVSLAENTPYTITLAGTDIDLDALTFAVASNPANGTLNIVAPNATPANIIYTPNTNYLGADSFTFVVNDGALTSTAATVSITVLPDNDGDGLEDVIDPDDDDDGIPDVVEGNGDPDGDGIPNHLDPDTDNDGILDSIETVITQNDSDNDGIDDAFDVDNTGGTDANGDGIDDNVLPLDTDGDGIADYLDLDSDNDGLSDMFESDRPVSQGNDTDSDGISDVHDADATGGGDINLDGIDDVFVIADTDNDGTPDYRDTDSDGDGILDTTEQILVPLTQADADNDGIDNAVDIDVTGGTDANNDGFDDAAYNPIDMDSDGIDNFRDQDSDGDGISDMIEAVLNTTDSDSDGIADYFDVDSTGGIDTNGDGIDDNVKPLDTDGDDIPDYLDKDSDNDGLSDHYETDRVAPTGIDADGNGIDDAYDVGTLTQADTDSDGIADFRDTDSDNDGLADTTEQILVTLSGTDADNDGIDDAVDVDATGGTDANGDGIDDAVFNSDDVDGDGIPNFRDTDSDGDSILDGDEPGDLNADGIADYLQIEGKITTGISGGGANSIILFIALLLFALPRKKHLLKAVQFVLLLVSAVNVQAFDSCKVKSLFNSQCWHLGVGLGLATLQPDLVATSWKNTEAEGNAYKLFAGFRTNSHLFYEFTYEYMGSTILYNVNPGNNETLEINYLAYGANVGFWLLNQKSTLNLHLKAGVAIMATEESPYTEQAHNTQLTTGAVIQWRFGESWSARLGMTKYDQDASVVNLSLSKHFGASKDNEGCSYKKGSGGYSNIIKNEGLMPIVREIMSKIHHNQYVDVTVGNRLNSSECQVSSLEKATAIIEFIKQKLNLTGHKFDYIHYKNKKVTIVIYPK